MSFCMICGKEMKDVGERHWTPFNGDNSGSNYKCENGHEVSMVIWSKSIKKRKREKK